MRRTLQFLGLVLVAGTLALASLPFWLGPVLRAAAGRAGVTFDSYERAGYASFVLRGVRFERPGTDLWIESIEAPTPAVWAWCRLRGAAVPVRAGTWELEFLRTGGASPPPAVAAPAADTAHGWGPLHERLAVVVAATARWLPSAEAGAGRIHAAGTTATIGAVKWGGRMLELDGVRLRGLRFDAKWSWPPDEEAWRLDVVSHRPEARGRLRGSGQRLVGEGELWGQAARGEALFASEGWLPLTAELDAVGWRLPGDRLRLGGSYAAVTGDLRVRWGERRLSLEAVADGEPLPEAEAPPLKVELRGGGGLRSLAIEALDVRMPGLFASLSSPIEVRLGERPGAAPSRFRVESDLASLPWPGWAGRFAGEATVTPQEGRWPRIEGRMEAQEIGRGEWRLTRATLQARLDWPVLVIGRFEGEEDNGGRWQGTGGWDFVASRLLPSRVEGVVPRAALERWLPGAWQFAQGEVTASGEGAWPAIRHEGSLRAAGLKAAPLKAVDVSISWSGEGAVLSRVDAVLARDGASLRLSGSGDARSARIETLESRAGEERRWTLASPIAVSWGDGVRVESLQWQHGASRFDLDLRLGSGQGGALRLAANEIDSAALADWIELPGPAWQVHALDLDGRWTDGPVEFGAAGRFSIALGEGRKAAIELAAAGDKDGVRVERLLASEGEAAVFRASGIVPLTFMPAGSPRWRLDPDRPLAATVASEPNPEFWVQVAQLTGLHLEAPVLNANLDGTWRRPRGGLVLSAQRVALRDGLVDGVVPELRDLSVRLSADGDGIELADFSLLVAGQALRARGRLPVGPGEWGRLLDEPRRALASGADLRIEIPDADVAALARHVPEYLAPTGRLSLDLSIKPDGEWEGYLRLEQAASRPLGPLGVLQEVGADIRFAGRTVEVRSATARMGGQQVRLEGSARWPAGAPSPSLDLALRGENLPFVRQTGLLVRGDLDLRLRTIEADRTRIEGAVHLRDSLFLADVRSLIPRGGRGAAPARRPPYFSVDVAPLRDWELDVEVSGERFLRLRTPLFNGTASARFRLGGTLGDPRALGEATINEGQVRLPFATFAVRQGAVRLTQAEPYDPQLSIDGTARRFGYDLRMELSGTASRPNLAFTSSPPLESGEVLLLVMAGEVPGDEFTYTSAQRAVRLGTYLGQNLIDRLGGDPARAERFSLTTGERVSRQGRETYGFSYELDHRWSLVGEYDEFDDYNVGLKRRLFASEPETENEEPDASHDP